VKKLEFSLLEVNARIDCDLPHSRCTPEDQQLHTRIKGMMSRVYSSFILLKHRILDDFGDHNISVDNLNK